MPVFLLQTVLSLLCLSLWLTSAVAWAEVENRALELDNQIKIDLLPWLDYLEDPEGQLTLEEVGSAAASAFKPLPDNNLGHSGSTFWLRFTLASSTANEPRYLLELAHFDVNEVVFYAPGQPPVIAGLDHPLIGEMVPYRFYTFFVDPSETPQIFYLRVRSDSAVILPLRLWQPVAFFLHAQRSLLLQALYHGGLLVLTIYNLLIFLSLRERSFLLYSLFAGSLGIGMFGLNGLIRQFMWPPDAPWPSEFHLTLGPLTIALALLFTQSFLHTQQTLPRLDRVIRLLVAWCLLHALAVWLGVPNLLLATGLSLLNLITAGLAIAAGLLAWRAGNPSARLFLLAWGILCLGVVVAGLHNLGWVSSNPLTSYALQLSSSLEMVLLSFALAERIRHERNRRESAQTEALNARQALVKALKQSEDRLEKTVQQRTAELDQALQNERELLDRYIHLGALIGHEFRNPLAIINSQLSLIERERDMGRDLNPQRLLAIGAATSRLGKLFEEWLQSDRLRQEKLQLNLISLPVRGWLQDLLQEAQDCYSDRQLSLVCPEPLPDLQADEALLRGAINNLIDNAIKYSPAGSAVELRVLERGAMLGIAVIDQGPGIPEPLQEAIFTDYFRAEPGAPVAGLGLGLTFVKRIVELHSGWIELQSQPEQGSGFCLWLPGIKRPQGTD